MGRRWPVNLRGYAWAHSTQSSKVSIDHHQLLVVLLLRRCQYSRSLVLLQIHNLPLNKGCCQDLLADTPGSVEIMLTWQIRCPLHFDLTPKKLPKDCVDAIWHVIGIFYL
jgi:hypothetical protein